MVFSRLQFHPPPTLNPSIKIMSATILQVIIYTLGGLVDDRATRMLCPEIISR